MKTITITLPGDLMAKLQVLADEQNKTVEEVIIAILEMAFAKDDI